MGAVMGSWRHHLGRKASLVVVSLLAGSCATAKVTNSVISPDYGGKRFTRVVALFAWSDARVRQSAETVFAERDDQTFLPAFFSIPAIDAGPEVVAQQLKETGAEAVLLITPSQELIGGGPAPRTATQVCIAYNPDWSCRQTVAVAGGGGQVAPLWEGFSATLYDVGTGTLVWSASVESKPEMGMTRPSLAELAQSAAGQLYDRLARDGLVRIVPR